jgi:hypothetical protein
MIPRFALRPPLPPLLLAQVLREIRHPQERAPIEVDLEELQAEARRIRGVYECSWPSVQGELALQYGPRFTRWLDREPDFVRSRHPMRELVTLYEVIAIPHPDGGYCIYSWRLKVRGEDERRSVWVQQTLLDSAMRNQRAAMLRHCERAG